MVIGIEVFKKFFKDFPDCYILIGGAACDIIIEEAGFEPRATYDLDIVLIVEALNPEFISKFWEFIKEGRYNTRQIDSEKRNCYRFCDRITPGFPKQIELFSKIPDIIDLDAEAHLTPIPVEEGLSGLSAILLNEEYYHFTLDHSVYKDDVHFANTEALICLKAYAHLDNQQRKNAGQNVKTRDIIKHKYDVFRMIYMLRPDDVFELPASIKKDMQQFADLVKDDLPNPEIFKDNGFGEQNMMVIYKQLLKNFNLSI